MPRICKIPNQVLMEVLEEHASDVKKYLRNSSASIWKTISEKFEGKITPKAVYTFVRCNKLNCWEKLHIQELLHNNANDDNTSSDTDDYDVKSVTITINSEKWNSIKPVQRYYGNRHRPFLENGWTDIINEELHAALATQCVWNFKNHFVYPSGEFYLIINGSCKECGASLLGRSISENAEENMIISFEIRNIRAKYHTGQCKRKLAGPKREAIGSLLSSGELAVNWRRKEALRSVKFGDISEPSTLYNLSTLRKCK